MSVSILIQGILLLLVWGTAAAIAILLWNKTRSSAILPIITGVVLEYISHAYSLFNSMGVSLESRTFVGGVDFFLLFLKLAPAVCFIIALLIMLKDK